VQIPKLLLHRLFPNVRFSVWIDAKLKLVVDPYLLLERYDLCEDLGLLYAISLRRETCHVL
jgi:hypothetical protein